MTEQPAGLLHWGQAGEYDAIYDRIVITALSGGTVGLARPPTLTPGAGLIVNIGRWNGTVDCEDGTLAVIGSVDAQTIVVPAGGPTVRTDYLFADIDPDAGVWSADLYAASELPGRAGLLLGTITVPANANSAAAMDFAPGPVALGAPGPWFRVPLVAGWNPSGGNTPITVRLISRGVVQITGRADRTAFTGQQPLANAGALPEIYRPIQPQYITGSLPQLATNPDAGIAIAGNGSLTAYAGAVSTVVCRVSGIYATDTATMAVGEVEGDDEALPLPSRRPR